MPAISGQTGGNLAAALATIRRRTDEPTVRAKYTDPILVDMLNESWQEVLPDLYNQADNPPLARYTVTLTQGQRYYNLPCTVGEIQRIAKRDTNNRVQWEIIPRDRLNPAGPGITFEGTQRFLIDPDFVQSEEIEVLYIPSGDCYMASGTATPAAGSTNTLRIIGSGTAVTMGAVDRRPNAYIGGILNIYRFDGSPPSGYSQFPIQQRIVRSYNVATGTLTVEPDFDMDLSGLASPSSLLYWEVYPLEATCVWPVLTRHVARMILSDEAKSARFQLMTQLYQEAKRACALRWSNFQTRHGDKLGNNIIDNAEYYWYVE